ncbi:CoA-binding domain protein [[Clostridium] ultunense Esp]|uniref:CoA-binding domain protein n=1 Tax=[Clostridium] ultunense Esp TaxID=1288971 RepID=M1YPR9_9FIRM|nr:CoA-binding protein [Schnuerera ultunensis]CCQ92545.1 CoA-binding domain protein [[Clostridium] ultunense Esp]SHD77316.1 CoA-binding domain protein [[Clostridium] ultunense Esp]
MVKKEMLDKKVWAVVGATPNKEKYGYKIWRKLIDHGYETYGINPNYDSIYGEKIYSNLKEVPKKIDVIDIVVHPEISLNTLAEAKELGIEYIWFQPGTFDDVVIEKAKDLGFKILYDDCVLATLIELEKK